jgi:peroxiredoxin
MSLKQEIVKMQETLLPQIPAEVLTLFTVSTQKLLQSGIADRSLRKGDKAPAFSLPGTGGKSIGSRELLQQGPLVLSFYRGDWCPYCDLELRALQRALTEVRSLGAQLVCISPQTLEKSIATAAKRELQFEVLSDADNAVARAFGLVFTLDLELQEIYPTLGIQLSESNGSDSGELPIPATFVIATDETIVYRYVNADYTQRAEPADILAVLRDIASER